MGFGGSNRGGEFIGSIGDEETNEEVLNSSTDKCTAVQPVPETAQPASSRRCTKSYLLKVASAGLSTLFQLSRPIDAALE